MRKGTIEYIEYVENGIKEEFKIICVSSCKGVGFLGDEEIKKGEIFNTNCYEFNYGGTYARLLRNGKVIGLFEQKKFLKLEDYRHERIISLEHHN